MSTESKGVERAPQVGDRATFKRGDVELAGEVVASYPVGRGGLVLVIETGFGPENRWHVPEHLAALSSPSSGEGG